MENWRVFWRQALKDVKQLGRENKLPLRKHSSEERWSTMSSSESALTLPNRAFLSCPPPSVLLMLSDLTVYWAINPAFTLPTMPASITCLSISLSSMWCFLLSSALHHCCPLVDLWHQSSPLLCLALDWFWRNYLVYSLHFASQVSEAIHDYI